VRAGNILNVYFEVIQRILQERAEFDPFKTPAGITLEIGKGWGIIDLSVEIPTN
jgi:hypothetical protein